MATSTLEPARAARIARSPSPSMRSRSRISKKKSDPFLDLPITPAQSPSPQRSPRDSPQSIDRNSHSETPDSLYSTLILAPLLFTSFLLSLFLVDRQNRAYRVSAHPSSSSAAGAWLSRIAPSKWWDPEPYEIVYDESAAGSAKPRKQPWYIKKKHRKIAKFEVNEAFELRTRVIVSMVVIMLALVIGAAFGLKQIYDWVWAG
jgi:hypothetical protein